MIDQQDTSMLLATPREQDTEPASGLGRAILAHLVLWVGLPVVSMVGLFVSYDIGSILILVGIPMVLFAFGGLRNRAGSAAWLVGAPLLVLAVIAKYSTIYLWNVWNTGPVVTYIVFMMSYLMIVLAYLVARRTAGLGYVTLLLTAALQSAYIVMFDRLYTYIPPTLWEFVSPDTLVVPLLLAAPGTLWAAAITRSRRAAQSTPAAVLAPLASASATGHVRGTEPLAVVSLVLSLLAISAVGGIVCGHIALSRIRQTGEDGRGLAVAGLVIGYIWLGLALLAVMAGTVLLISAF